MKRIGVAVFGLAMMAAAFAGAITEKTAVNILWDADAAMPVTVWTNGVVWRAFGTNQYQVLGTTNGMATFRLVTTAPGRGTYLFTATQNDGQFESDPSNVVTQSFKAWPPQNVRMSEK
jgi:hypothetical protein